MKSILSRIHALCFLMVLPALANDVGPHNSSAQPTRVQTKLLAKENLDGTIGVCWAQLNPGTVDPKRDERGEYALDVRDFASANYSQGPGKDPSLLADYTNAKITVLQAPKHGTLGQGHYPGNDLSYYPDPNYFGKDMAVFLIDIEGHLVKVEYYIKLVSGNDFSKFADDYNKYCPSPNWWKISQPPDASTITGDLISPRKLG